MTGIIDRPSLSPVGSSSFTNTCLFTYLSLRWCKIHVLSHYDLLRRSSSRCKMQIDEKVVSFYATQTLTLAILFGPVRKLEPRKKPSRDTVQASDVLKFLKWLPVAFRQSLKAWLRSVRRMAEKGQGNLQFLSQFLSCLQESLRWHAGECFV